MYEKRTTNGMNRLFEYSREKLFTRAACHRFQQEYCFVVMSDSHVDNGPDSAEIFQSALTMAAKYDPLFILHTGDLIRTGEYDRFAYFLTLLDQLPEIYDIPLFIVAGNHDKSITDTDDAFKYFKGMIGPLNFAISLAGQQLTLCGINTADYRVDPGTLTNLNHNLDCHDQPIKIIAMHVPPHAGIFKNFEAFSHLFHPGQRPNTFAEGMPELLQILCGHKATMAFSGHIHAYLPDLVKLPGCPEANSITDRAAIPWIVTGGTGGTLSPGFAFHIIVVTVKLQDCGNYICHPQVIPIY